jgi:hypothetical protein
MCVSMLNVIGNFLSGGEPTRRRTAATHGTDERTETFTLIQL